MNKKSLCLAFVCLLASAPLLAEDSAIRSSDMSQAVGSKSASVFDETEKYSVIQGYINNGQLSKAEFALNELVAANPLDSKALTLLARVNVKNNNAKQAIAFYQDAFSFSNKISLQDYIDRANDLMNLTPLPLSTIEIGLNQGIEKLGYQDELMMLIVDANLLAKKQLRAHYWINSLSDDLKKQPNWLLKRAQIFEQEGDAKKALALYRQVVTYINYQPVSSRRSPLLSQAREESYLAISRLAKN